MFKGGAITLYFALVLLPLVSVYNVKFVPVAFASEAVIEVQGVLFAFGWSANIGDRWLVNGETIVLNSRALVMPPSSPIEGDAGPPQMNIYKIYLNNIGFCYGWSSNISDRYRPSISMIVGAGQAFSGKGLLNPPHAPIYEDAGPAQTNPSLIYLNNIGFHNAWSRSVTDRYRPSDSIVVGSQLTFNSKAFVEPLIPSDAGPCQQNLALIYLNNVGFHFGWGPNTDDRYCPSTTMDVGALRSLNPRALRLAPSWAIGIDIIPPFIDIPTREPSGDIMPDQPVRISVAVTDTESGVKNVTLWYSTNNGTTWTTLNMTELAANTFQATIPGYGNCTWVTYKIVAYDNADNMEVKDNNGYNYQYHVIPEFSINIMSFLILAMLTSTVIIIKGKKN